MNIQFTVFESVVMSVVDMGQNLPCLKKLWCRLLQWIRANFQTPLKLQMSWSIMLQFYDITIQ